MPDTMTPRDRLSPYEVTERQLQAIEEALNAVRGDPVAESIAPSILNVIDGIRAGAPPEPDTATADLNAELLERLRVTQQQRDLLDRACASYIERQAAEKAASGLISLAVANAWANEQRLVIASAMQQIAPPQVQED